MALALESGVNIDRVVEGRIVEVGIIDVGGPSRDRLQVRDVDSIARCALRLIQLPKLSSGAEELAVDLQRQPRREDEGLAEREGEVLGVLRPEEEGVPGSVLEAIPLAELGDRGRPG